MSSDSSQQPRSGKRGSRLPLPRWALWLMLPGMIAPILIFGFIVWSEAAHDEQRCPFQELSRKSLEPEVEVIEEVRSCVSGIEEHRYILRRGDRSQLLGERRFQSEAFAPDRYRWEAVVTEEGEVQVTVYNAGHRDLLLREGTPEERAQGISH